MFLRTRVRTCRPRRWQMETVTGLLAAVVLAWAIVPSPAAPAPEPPAKKEEPKKEEPRKPAAPDPFPFPDIEKFLPPGVIDPEQMKELQKIMDETRKQLEELQKQFGRMQPGAVPGLRLRRFGDAGQEARMGAQVLKPDATLADQLNLPDQQGIVLKGVKSDSAAAKAGLKDHDILLELDGKPVPSDMDKFQKLLKDIKPDAAVDAVVLRKGKKETVKGLKLPEAKEQPNPFRNLQPFQLPRNFPFPGGGGVQMQVGNITLTKNADGTFTARSDQNGVKITVTGRTEDNKAKVDEIEVNDGKEAKKYKSVADVPEAHREAVKNLIQMTEGNRGFRFEFRNLP